MNQRTKKQRDVLLKQLDYELGESSRLFIMERPLLREIMGWKEEENPDIKKKENSVKIRTITKFLLKLME